MADFLPQAGVQDLNRRLDTLERSARRVRREFKSLERQARAAAEADRRISHDQAGLNRDLAHLLERLEALSRIVNLGNGERGHTTRIALLENDMADLQESMREVTREHWKLLASLVTGLLSLVSSALLWFVKGGP